MKGFALDHGGDLELRGGRIRMIEGNELLRQTCECVLGTNRGEWAGNPEEGIDRRALLTGKHPDGETLRGELLAGLQQGYESFSLESFSCEMTSDRRLLLTFSARSGSGEAVTGSRMV